MHNPEPVRENETKTSRVFWDHLISARRSDLMIANKRKKEKRIVDFAVPSDHWVKLKESEKRDKYLDLATKLKNYMEHESDSDTNCYWCARHSHQRIGTGTGGLANKRMRGNHSNYSIIQIGQNTEKSLGDLRRLAVTQIPTRNHRLTLAWKTLKSVNNNNNNDNSKLWHVPVRGLSWPFLWLKRQ